MYGLHGKLRAQPGQRDVLLKLFLDSSSTYDMPGCRIYIVSADLTDPDAIWIFEVWETQASHQASLQIDAVQALIRRARPLIAGMSDRVEFTPLAGRGLSV